MISTGNDIVSFNQIDITRTKLPQFYSKILSATELPLYQKLENAGIPFERFVWLLWAVKESAYKFLQRLNHSLVFSPTKFIIDQVELSCDFNLENFNGCLEGCGSFCQPSINGTVNYLYNQLKFSALINNDFVNSVAYVSNDQPVNYWGVKKIEHTGVEIQSAEVRAIALNKLKELSGLHDLKIIKDQHRIPHVVSSDKVLTIPVSLSHHGHYIAYSFYYDLNRQPADQRNPA